MLPSPPSSPPEMFKDRWALLPDGGIAWTVTSGAAAHDDHIEMSGQRVSAIIRYGIDAGGHLVLSRRLIWPMLRTIPNNTHASLQQTWDNPVRPAISVDGAPLGPETPTRFVLDGASLTIESKVGDGLTLTRTLLPSRFDPVVIERFTLTNAGNAPCQVKIDEFAVSQVTDPARGVDGAYRIEGRAHTGGLLNSDNLAPGDACTFVLVWSARKDGAPEPIPEAGLRRRFVDDLRRILVLETPEPILDRAFAFAKVRAAESVFATKGGLMHAPGGGPYYAAIWANDQAEYANPLFAYLGDPDASESAENAFRHFARFMNSEYRPIPSSIIAEGTDTWHGAGDRGDMAMIAYGAGRFALARGDRTIAESLWPLIEWCLEYLKRKTDNRGVIRSDSDELENRFPAGDANLATSCLAYDALRSASLLAAELGKGEELQREFANRADTLRAAIERHFGAKVEGFDTYRYYDGNTVLRAWICIPLTVGIVGRAGGTLDALFSPRLWTIDGLATEAGQTTFWDRATLYGLRGALAAGATERAMAFLRSYTRRRLLGEHVPYPVEAYPEGDQRHLSAESALLCRVFVEGLFGFRPTGLTRFELTPRLPDNWPEMSLKRVHAAGRNVDIEVARDGESLTVTIRDGEKTPQTRRIKPGETTSA